ncbi:hypothetical protein C8J56DRAFT_1062106 [Mycena floridula]|nr:hypothetical protein C8J56DRAFT_1062106 [Mycena floridula]
MILRRRKRLILEIMSLMRLTGIHQALSREQDNEIMALKFHLQRRDKRISELEQYVTALEKARDLLRKMRANYNQVLDQIDHVRAKVERMNEMLAAGFKQMMTEVMDASTKGPFIQGYSPEAVWDANQAKSQATWQVLYSNTRRINDEFREEYGNGQDFEITQRLPLRYDLKVSPEAHLQRALMPGCHLGYRIDLLIG